MQRPVLLLLLLLLVCVSCASEPIRNGAVGEEETTKAGFEEFRYELILEGQPTLLYSWQVVVRPDGRCDLTRHNRRGDRKKVEQFEGELSPIELAELNALVQGEEIWEFESKPRDLSPGARLFKYAVTIGGKTRTRQRSDPETKECEPLRELTDLLQEVIREISDKAPHVFEAP